MKIYIILLSLLGGAFLPHLTFAAEPLEKFRKRGTASVEREHAQQAEKLIVPTSDGVITSDDINSNEATKRQSSMNASSKLASDADINKSKRRLRFNAPQE